ncbi:MAG: metallophosphoesterase family protein [Actinomycetota bacterium]
MDEPPTGRGRRVGALAAAIAVGLVGAWIGMALFARTTVPLGPFHVELGAGFGRGETRLGLPPFGALTADTHLSPLGLSATLQDVGVEGLTDAVYRQGIDGLVAAVERDARERIPVFAWQVLTAAAVGGTVLAMLVFRARWRLVAASASSSVLGVALCLILVLASFRPGAFAEPTYSGSLTLAPKLLGSAREATDRIDDLRAGLEQIVDGTVRAYTTLQSTPIGGDGIRVLHISDIHASPLGMDFAREVALGFDVDLVIDTGDITSFATPIENLIVSRIPEFGRPYVFVRGSHDSVQLQSEIGRQSNGVVLDGQARTLSGLTVYGLGHPAFTPARGIDVDEEAFEELAIGAGDVIAADLLRIEEPVDVIAVHDDRMALAVAGRVPVVLSGHFHETTAVVVNGTVFLRLATTGGSGAGIFRALGEVPFTAEVLYFSAGDDPELIAYDVIEQASDSGSLTVSRVNVEEEYGELVLTPSPTVTLTSPSPTGTPSGR